jgi:ParB-like chromosome segregation protein Spo0J
MPAMSALKEDILQRGVLVPVERDDFGNTLDGHRREQIVNELRQEDIEVQLPVVTRTVRTDAQKRAHVRALNLHRRHLDRAGRRRLIAEQLKETPERSNRQIANGLGCDHKTVGAVRQEAEAAGEIPQLNETVGADNKKRTTARREASPRLTEATTHATVPARVDFGPPSAEKAGELPDSMLVGDDPPERTVAGVENTMP